MEITPIYNIRIIIFLIHQDFLPNKIKIARKIPI